MPVEIFTMLIAAPLLNDNHLQLLAEYAADNVRNGHEATMEAYKRYLSPEQRLKVREYILFISTYDPCAMQVYIDV